MVGSGKMKVAYNDLQIQWIIIDEEYPITGICKQQGKLVHFEIDEEDQLYVITELTRWQQYKWAIFLCYCRIREHLGV